MCCRSLCKYITFFSVWLLYSCLGLWEYHLLSVTLHHVLLQGPELIFISFQLVTQVCFIHHILLQVQVGQGIEKPGLMEGDYNDMGFRISFNPTYFMILWPLLFGSRTDSFQCWDNSKSQIFLRRNSMLWKGHQKLQYSEFCAALWRYQFLMICRAQTAGTHRHSVPQVSSTNSSLSRQNSSLCKWCVCLFVLPLLSSWQHQWILLYCHIGFCFRSSSHCKHQPGCSTPRQSGWTWKVTGSSLQVTSTPFVWLQ